MAMDHGHSPLPLGPQEVIVGPEKALRKMQDAETFCGESSHGISCDMATSLDFFCDLCKCDIHMTYLFLSIPDIYIYIIICIDIITSMDICVHMYIYI